MRAIVIAGTIVVAVIILPIYWLRPPLRTGPPPSSYSYAALQSLSGPARAGQSIFGDHCARCHGTKGAGGTAPALSDGRYARDFMAAKDLHNAIGRPIPEHAALTDELSAADANTRFNRVELMGKYLRELRTVRDDQTE